MLLAVSHNSCLVSFVLPWRDDPRISTIVRSFLSATNVEDAEMIVVSDGSTQESLTAVAAQVKGRSNCQIIVLPASRGPGAARNVGLGQARGAWIHFIDADDKVDFPQVIAAAQRWSGTRFDVVACGYTVIDQRTPVEQRRTVVPLVQNEAIDLARQCVYQAAVWRFLFKRSLLETHPSPFPSLRYAEDIVMLLGLSAQGARLACDSALIYTHYLRLSSSSAMTLPFPVAKMRARAAECMLKDLVHESRNQYARAVAVLWILRIRGRTVSGLPDQFRASPGSARSRRHAGSSRLRLTSPRVINASGVLRSLLVVSGQVGWLRLRNRKGYYIVGNDLVSVS